MRLNQTRELTDQIKGHQDIGLEYLRSKHYQDAIDCLGEAAKYSYLLASISENGAKREYKEHADALLRKIRVIKGRMGGKEKIKENGERVKEKPSNGVSLPQPKRKPVVRKEQPKPKDKDLEEKVSKWTVEERTNVSFDDIAGLDNVKLEIVERMVFPYKYPAEAAQYNIQKGGGVLLYGPPGTGKTMIGKAIATEIDAAFINVSPSELISGRVGQQEQNVKSLFEAARRYQKAVIFIDEIEALIPDRGRNRSTIMERVVTQFLQELQGFKERDYDLLFIGATNHPYKMDPAALRTGRFDIKIYVGLPDREARESMFENYLRKVEMLGGGMDYGRLADMTEGFSGSDITEICNKASREGFRGFIRTSVKNPLSMEYLETAIESTKPSVDSTVLEKNLEFREKYGG